MASKARGDLIVIGGHEPKEGDRAILKEVSRRAIEGTGRLIIVTAATRLPEEVGEEYTTVFRELGVPDVEVLDIRKRADAYDEANLKKLDGASVIFFTGGDQLRITSQMGDTPVYQTMHALHRAGGVIAGTSAGAAVMPHTMLAGGPNDSASQISALGMAPGLGLLQGVVVDSHFAERGRMGRLLGAVAQNPANLGVGIDEATAIIVDHTACFRVLGEGGVHVVDGAGISFSSLSEERPEGVLSIYDVRLHVLSEGDCFDLKQRRPIVREG